MTLSAEQARRDGAFTRGAPGGPLWQFLRGFLKHPVMVGSVIPSLTNQRPPSLTSPIAVRQD